MLHDLVDIHRRVIERTPLNCERYLFKKINWNLQAICVVGGRGTGKTTLLCQAIIKYYGKQGEALYISADNIKVLQYGLFDIAGDFFKQGGEAIFIDEVHKYPNWSQEIKNIIDSYPDKKVVFTASSSVDLNQSKADLSRRVIYYNLKVLSFREYLHFNHIMDFEAFSLKELLDIQKLDTHLFEKNNVLKHFNHYLQHGQYPFYLEGIDEYHMRVLNVIEKVLYEDIAVIYNLRQTTITMLKQLLWLIATSKSFSPNIDKISKSLQVSRQIIYNALDYLSHSGLVSRVFSEAKGLKLLRKPGKIFLDNTSLLIAVMGSLNIQSDVGNMRETFFVNQVAGIHKIALHDKGDFCLDSQHVIEVGGAGKTTKQIKDVPNSFLAVDNIIHGFGNTIPLYLFGCLY